MRRIALLVTFSFVMWLVLVPTAWAQQGQYADEEVEQQFQEQIEEQVEAPVDVEVQEGAGEQIQAIEEQVGEEATIPVQGPLEEQIEQKAEEQSGEPVEVTVQGVETEQPKSEQPKADSKGKAKEVPKTGGPVYGSLLVAAAALLLGTGILGYTLLRRR